MTTLSRLLAAGLLATAMPAGGATAQASAPAAHARAPARISTERLAAIRPLLQRYVDQGRIAGAVVQVQQDGRTVFSTAVGWRDKEARAPMRQDTIFRIASQTKALTSVAAMMLMEEGKLLLGDPVGKYLPEWSSTTVAVPRPNGGYAVVPAKRAITIRDLLTHTAGISYGGGPAEAAWRDAGFLGWYWDDRREPLANAVARMAALPMAAQPGEQFVYGYNTDILGVIVEKLSGQTLDAFLRERLIEPLGMKDTAFYAPPPIGWAWSMPHRPARSRAPPIRANGATGDMSARGIMSMVPAPPSRAVRGCCRRPPTTAGSSKCSGAAERWTGGAIWAASRWS